jgi:hypothetical protein
VRVVGEKDMTFLKNTMEMGGKRQQEQENVKKECETIYNKLKENKND